MCEEGFTQLKMIALDKEGEPCTAFPLCDVSLTLYAVGDRNNLPIELICNRPKGQMEHLVTGGIGKLNEVVEMIIGWREKQFPFWKGEGGKEV